VFEGEGKRREKYIEGSKLMGTEKMKLKIVKLSVPLIANNLVILIPYYKGVFKG